MKTYDLKLTQEDIQIICNVLGELPLRVSINVFSKIQQQTSNKESREDVIKKEVE